MKRFAVALTLLSVAACAAAPRPDAELAAARTALLQARPLAQEHAPAELAAAEAKLTAAEQALAHDETTRARRLAEQAEVDAKLAQAIAENERSRVGR
jgi:uncharacterized protein DUF4398